MAGHSNGSPPKNKTTILSPGAGKLPRHLRVYGPPTAKVAVDRDQYKVLGIHKAAGKLTFTRSPTLFRIANDYDDGLDLESKMSRQVPRIVGGSATGDMVPRSEDISMSNTSVDSSLQRRSEDNVSTAGSHKSAISFSLQSFTSPMWRLGLKSESVIATKTSGASQVSAFGKVSELTSNSVTVGESQSDIIDMANGNSNNNISKNENGQFHRLHEAAGKIVRMRSYKTVSDIDEEDEDEDSSSEEETEFSYMTPTGFTGPKRTGRETLALHESAGKVLMKWEEPSVAGATTTFSHSECDEETYATESEHPGAAKKRHERGINTQGLHDAAGVHVHQPKSPFHSLFGFAKDDDEVHRKQYTPGNHTANTGADNVHRVERRESVSLSLSSDSSDSECSEDVWNGLNQYDDYTYSEASGLSDRLERSELSLTENYRMGRVGTATPLVFSGPVGVASPTDYRPTHEKTRFQKKGAARSNEELLQNMQQVPSKASVVTSLSDVFVSSSDGSTTTEPDVSLLEEEKSRSFEAQSSPAGSPRPTVDALKSMFGFNTSNHSRQFVAGEVSARTLFSSKSDWTDAMGTAALSITTGPMPPPPTSNEKRGKNQQDCRSGPTSGNLDGRTDARRLQGTTKSLPKVSSKVETETLNVLPALYTQDGEGASIELAVVQADSPSSHGVPSRLRSVGHKPYGVDASCPAKVVGGAKAPTFIAPVVVKSNYDSPVGSNSDTNTTSSSTPSSDTKSTASTPRSKWTTYTPGSKWKISNFTQKENKHNNKTLLNRRHKWSGKHAEYDEVASPSSTSSKGSSVNRKTDNNNKRSTKFLLSAAIGKVPLKFLRGRTNKKKTGEEGIRSQPEIELVGSSGIELIYAVGES